MECLYNIELEVVLADESKNEVGRVLAVAHHVPVVLQVLLPALIELIVC